LRPGSGWGCKAKIGFSLEFSAKIYNERTYMSESTSPKPFVFVLMPFAKEYNDTYKLGIKEACEDAGAYCERVDEQIFTERILDRVYNTLMLWIKR
jgi:hypothetical protein